jgi:acyl carrier protein
VRPARRGVAFRFGVADEASRRRGQRGSAGSFDMEELKDQLRQIIAGIGGPSNEFDASADLYRDLHLASFQAADLLTAIEERYQVTIPDDQYLNARSLNDLTSIVTRLIEN